MKFEEYREIIPDFDLFMERIGVMQPYWIRVNTLKIDEKNLVERLGEKGFVLEKYGDMNAYRVRSMPVKHPGATIEHSLGYYYVQDLSSMMPVLALAPRDEDTILDMAAAPGSKTTMMAEIMKNNGTIVANDVSIERIRALIGNIERLGITNTLVTRKDATRESFYGKFDRILLDAPCTGEGIVRKNPGFRYPTLRDHLKLQRIQKRMVKNAYRHLRDGGIMVYSTCTFNPLENEAVVDYAITQLNMKIRAVNLPIPHSEGITEWKNYTFDVEVKKSVRIYPHMVDTGGMFIAVLQK